MRISDWSSDVCSSDLLKKRPPQHRKPAPETPWMDVLRVEPFRNVAPVWPRHQRERIHQPRRDRIVERLACSDHPGKAAAGKAKNRLLRCHSQILDKIDEYAGLVD